MENRNTIVFKSTSLLADETPEHKFMLVDHVDLEKYVVNNIPLAIKTEDCENKFTKISNATRGQIAKNIISSLLGNIRLYRLESISVDEVILDSTTLPANGETVKIFNENFQGELASYDQVNQIFIVRKTLEEVSVYEVRSWSSR